MERQEIKHAKKFMFTTMMSNGLKYGNIHTGDNFLDYTPRCFRKHLKLIFEHVGATERFVVYKWEINHLTLYVMGRSGNNLEVNESGEIKEESLKKIILEIIKTLVFSENLSLIYMHLEELTGVKITTRGQTYASIVAKKDELSRPGSPV